MSFFVEQESVVRKIWGKGDTILFIFAGASAEFALNKAVDWLYYTGRLPADPLGRLFSTVNYALKIVFSENDAALIAIDKIAAIHRAVEQQRAAHIPDWAYRDVLFMLIDYSIRSYEILERKLSYMEKEEVFDVFNRVGLRMNLTGLPGNYNDWMVMRNEHLQNDLIKSNFTIDLYKQYRKHLGPIRYKLLIEGQILVVPQSVNDLLKLGGFSLLAPVLSIYKILRSLKLDWFLKAAILPKEYKEEIKELDVMTRK
ncbi:MAG: DUF2236 domain-containing protein [Bacteroidota bacterium]|nr:DUF2236 domain-containing protein [Bacteroidota bacterium]